MNHFIKVPIDRIDVYLFIVDILKTKISLFDLDLYCYKESKHGTQIRIHLILKRESVRGPP